MLPTTSSHRLLLIATKPTIGKHQCTEHTPKKPRHGGNDSVELFLQFLSRTHLSTTLVQEGPPANSLFVASSEQEVYTHQESSNWFWQSRQKCPKECLGLALCCIVHRHGNNNALLHTTTSTHKLGSVHGCTTNGWLWFNCQPNRKQPGFTTCWYRTSSDNCGWHVAGPAWCS